MGCDDRVIDLIAEIARLKGTTETAERIAHGIEPTTNGA